MSVAALPKLSPYITEDLQGKANSLNRQATWHLLATQVSAVAFVALVGVIACASLGVGILMPPVFIVTLILGTAFFPPLIGYCYGQKDTFEKEAKIAQGQADALKIVDEWTEDKRAQFFTEHKISPSETFATLRPAIAQFVYWKQRAEALYKESQEARTNKNLDRSLRTAVQAHGWSTLVSQAIPSAIRAALMLEIIRNPRSKLTVETLGGFRSPSPEQQFLSERASKRSECFLFAKEREPLLVHEVEGLLVGAKFDALSTLLIG